MSNTNIDFSQSALSIWFNSEISSNFNLFGYFGTLSKYYSYL